MSDPKTVNAPDERGNTALHRAMAPYGAALAEVERLIAAGADVNAQR